MFSAGLAGMSIGPCAAAATFAITGNTWHVNTLQHVILVGMVLAVVPISALLFLNDDQSLGAESDAVPSHQNANGDSEAGKLFPFMPFRSIRQRCCKPAAHKSKLSFDMGIGLKDQGDAPDACIFPIRQSRLVQSD